MASILDGKRPLLERLRKAVRVVPAPLVWLLAAAGVYRLSGGHLLHTSWARGYAEARSYAVAPLQGGVVDKVEVEVGQTVKAGQPVARMNARAVEVKLLEARAELGRRQADLLAQGDINEAEVTRSEIWVVRTRAEAQADRAESKELEQRLKRLEGLAAQKLVSADDLELARRMNAARQAEIETLDRAVKAGQAGFAEGRPRSSLAGRSHEESVRRRVEPYREAIRVQEAVVRQLELELERLTLRAPVDGRVALVLKRGGEVVAAYTEVVRLVTARTGVVMVPVPEPIARGIVAGGGARLDRLSDGPGQRRFRGKVLSVGPDIEESTQRSRPAPHIPVWGRTVFVQIDGPDELLPGEAFDVRFD